MKSLYDLSTEVTAVDGQPLSSFKGKVLLIVNSATECGFSYQFADLQTLYERYKERGFVVLAFPSNDYAGQEPRADEEIAHYCELKYEATFPFFPRAPVSGENKQAVYQFLTEETSDAYRGDPGWNFVKFLVNQNGQVVGRFSAITSPLSRRITRHIEDLLAEHPEEKK